MKRTPLHALIQIATHTTTSSVELSDALGISQQTASRWLIELCQEGLVEKTPRGYRVTNKGEEHLATLLPPSNLEFNGRVFTGLQEGRYYLNKEGYRSQFPSLLGFQPYPGTLNIRMESEQDKQINRRLRAGAAIYLKGFTEKDRSYGGARCYKVLIQKKVWGALIVPDRTHYPEDVAELLAPVCLRRKLKLKDRDVVSVKAHA